MLGYGNQGRAQAQCMRDSGVSVIVGARKRGRSFREAERDGFPVMPIGEAVRRADAACVLISDMAQGKVFRDEILPSLKPGKTLYFSHGFNVAFGIVKPPKGVDVILVAPKATGSRLREAYLNGENVPLFVSVWQDATGNAGATAEAFARALGPAKGARKAFRCTFAQEAVANVFGEQAVTLGGAMQIAKAGFETMVERGIPPELAYHECVAVTKLVVDLLYARGLKGTVFGVSETAAYGGLSRGKRVVGEAVKKEMREIFSEIEDGRFAEEWLSEHARGGKRFREMKRAESRHPLEAAHRKAGKKS